MIRQKASSPAPIVSAGARRIDQLAGRINSFDSSFRHRLQSSERPKASQTPSGKRLLKGTSKIVIVVDPVGIGRFRARLAQGGIVIVTSSRQPFLDSARVLVAAGFDPASLLEMWHVGSAHFALRGPLRVAATLTVEERDARPPRFVKWWPLDLTEGSLRTAENGSLQGEIADPFSEAPE